MFHVSSIGGIVYSIYVVKTRDDLLNSSISPNVTSIPEQENEIQEISIPLSDVMTADDFYIAIKAHNGPLTVNLNKFQQEYCIFIKKRKDFAIQIKPWFSFIFYNL